MAAGFFCGIGVQKSGTTWLAQYLRALPDVYMPPVKELQIFSRVFRPELFSWMDEHFRGVLSRQADRLIKGAAVDPDILPVVAEMLAIPRYKSQLDLLRAYRRLFRSRAQGAKMFGEFSATYCLLPPEGLRQICAAFPDARIILLLRDPVARYWSHLKHQMRFDPAFDPAAAFAEKLAGTEFSEASDYEPMIARLHAVLPAERIHIGFYERFFLEQREDALQAVTSFLGVDFVKPDFAKVVYEGAKLEIPAELAVLGNRRFARSYAFVRQRFGSLPTGWDGRGGQ